MKKKKYKLSKNFIESLDAVLKKKSHPLQGSGGTAVLNDLDNLFLFELEQILNDIPADNREEIKRLFRESKNRVGEKLKIN